MGQELSSWGTFSVWLPGFEKHGGQDKGTIILEKALVNDVCQCMCHLLDNPQ